MQPRLAQLDKPYVRMRDTKRTSYGCLLQPACQHGAYLPNVVISKHSPNIAHAFAMTVPGYVTPIFGFRTPAQITRSVVVIDPVKVSRVRASNWSGAMKCGRYQNVNRSLFTVNPYTQVIKTAAHWVLWLVPWKTFQWVGLEAGRLYDLVNKAIVSSHKSRASWDWEQLNHPVTVALGRGLACRS